MVGFSLSMKTLENIEKTTGLTREEIRELDTEEISRRIEKNTRGKYRSDLYTGQRDRVYSDVD